MKRHISLYYGSVDLLTCLRMFCGILSNVFYSRKRIQDKLLKEVARRYQHTVGVYAFTSARGATAAFLKASNVAGGEVLVSSYTCLAVPTAVIAAEGIPVYCDIEKSNLNVDINNISKKLTTKTRVIIAQHTLGSLLDVSAIRRQVQDKEVYILEDCALSVGSRYKGEFLGSEGDAAIYSLELSKTISTGWGGILVVKNQKIKEILDDSYSCIPEEKFWNSLRDALQTIASGVSYQPVFYNILGKYIIYFGYKYKAFRVSTPPEEPEGKLQDNFIRKLPAIQLQAALYQWKRLDLISEKTKKNFTRISECLNKSGLKNFVPEASHAGVSPRISFLVARPLEAMDYFAARGIELGRWFDGPLSPPPRSDKFRYNSVEFPNAAFLARHVVNLPCHSRLSAKDTDHIITTLYNFAVEQPSNRINWE